MPDTWDSAGILAFQYEMSLVTGAWLASRVMTPEQSFENALTCYHGLLLQVMRAKSKAMDDIKKQALEHAGTCLRFGLPGWLAMYYHVLPRAILDSK